MGWLHCRAVATPYHPTGACPSVLGGLDLRAGLPLAYPPFYLLPVFYLATCLVFYLAVQNLAAFSLWQLARLGWCFGFGQFASGMAWIGEAFLVEAELFLWALPFAVTGLPAGLALFHAAAFTAFGALAKGFRLPPIAAYSCLALLLALSEYAWPVLTGLPWNLPSMGWAGWLYLAQPVALSAFMAYRFWPIERCFAGQRKPPRRFAGPRLASGGLHLLVFCARQ